MDLDPQEQKRIAHKLWVEAWEVYREQTEIQLQQFEQSLPVQRIVRKLSGAQERNRFLREKAKEIALLKTFCLLGASILQQQAGSVVGQSPAPSDQPPLPSVLELTDEQIEAILDLGENETC